MRGIQAVTSEPPHRSISLLVSSWCSFPSSASSTSVSLYQNRVLAAYSSTSLLLAKLSLPLSSFSVFLMVTQEVNDIILVDFDCFHLPFTDHKVLCGGIMLPIWQLNCVSNSLWLHSGLWEDKFSHLQREAEASVFGNALLLNVLCISLRGVWYYGHIPVHHEDYSVDEGMHIREVAFNNSWKPRYIVTWPAFKKMLFPILLWVKSSTVPLQNLHQTPMQFFPMLHRAN